MYKNFLLLNLKSLILLNKLKSIVNILSTNILIYDNFNSNSNYINNSLLLEIDFVNR